MKSLAVLAAIVFISSSAQAASAPCAASVPGNEVRKSTLSAFSGEPELDGLLKCLAERVRQRQQEARTKQALNPVLPGQPMMPAPSPVAAAPAAAPAAESVTNTQTRGVDEGGIVKVHGRHLVILRRGRLFTVDIDGAHLKPVAAIDAFAPSSDPGGAWYDEMLIADNTIVVVGYSYQRGGTEIGLFDIDAAGKLGYRATWHLRSNDYYSSRNYASRLIGSKLIFYSPLRLNLSGSDLHAGFPAARRWRKDAAPGDFQRIAPATRIYRTDDPIEDEYGLTLHTVAICDLATAEMECTATAVMGPPGRVFYVSAGSVFVWTTRYATGTQGGAARSALFRIPLDGAVPTAIKTAGAPIDQFSFLESADGHLNVLVRAKGRGDAMWAAEGSSGDTALLRVRLDSFGDGRDSAPLEAYRRLPFPAGYTLQNRFIGNFLLFGAGSSWGQPQGTAQALHAVRWDIAAAAQTVPLAHSVDRIEAMGGDALVVGTQGKSLLFSSIRLGSEATYASLYSRKDSAQGETRSHGFFYKPTAEGEGLVGLPVTGGGRPGYRQLSEGSAAVLFLRNRSLRLTELGSLDAQPNPATNDACRASCVDWYGNARPLFLRNRVFALMGYELVEGRITSEKIIQEVRRISFAPVASAVAR